MIFIRRFSCRKKICVLKHIEENMATSNKIHSDIYKRQDYIQRQINDVYFDINNTNKKIDHLESIIKQLYARIKSNK